ncbi:MAG: arginine--tRNA ligase [Clostridiales bacterium]|jgi:arginyl-tRNA synthetase|nr:arginine--tRNA ligase [Clostridiales bacterium]
MDFKLEVAKLIANAATLDLETIAEAIEIPPNPDLGDFAFPCFRLAKTLRKAPPIIAQEIKQNIEMPDFLASVEIAGAYINFFVKRDFYAEEVLRKIFEQGANFGRQNLGNGGCVVIDYSHPNMAKPFHVGHLRSTVIGHALYNIFNFLGYRSFSINYLGDWGTQFGKVIAAYENWGSKEEVDAGGIAELNRLYVKFHVEVEADKTLDEQARAWHMKMEQGDEYALALWHWFKEISMKEYAAIYRLFDIDFDSYQGESFYNDKMSPVVERLRESGLLTESDGAMIVELEEHKMPPCLILRSDGGTLYATRDITSVLHRKEAYNFVKALYVTSHEQILHFAQVFKVIELMGHDFELMHVPFGYMNLPGGKMSTRKGNVLLMQDLLDQTIDKIKGIIEEKNPDLKDKEVVAQQVGIGAVIFNDLYNSRIKDVEFSWERMLSFEGETGPYVQYTHARCCSVLNKAVGATALGRPFADANLGLLTDAAEFELIKILNGFPEKIAEAAEKYEPFIISRFVMQLAQAFNKFYRDNPILRAEEELKKARLHLTHCTKTVIAAALNLLGIKAPQEM